MHNVCFRNYAKRNRENSSNKSSKTAKYLESRIGDVAFKAIDIIDSHVANRLYLDDEESVICLANLFGEPKVDWDECLFKDLDEVIMEEINSIKQEVMQLKEIEKGEEGHNDEPGLQSTISLPTVSWPPPSIRTTTMIGLDDDLMEIKTRLLGNSSKLEIVSLVGMGGIGKTTLATKVYDDSYIAYHFHIRAWATVSQEYNVRNILLALLGANKSSQGKDEELAEKLYKSLKGMRFFVVLDDLWDAQIWDYLRRLFPDDSKGSRILLTTRLEQVAKEANSCPPLHRMRLLEDEESWNLFCKKVFEKSRCPLELEEIGKEIIQNCRGLPLAVNVIGGHLSKATRMEHYWRSVTKNLSETIVSEDDEHCSKILSLSYRHLPNHLKGCFLLMSIFPEDCEIKVRLVLNLWIASGLIKQETSKSSKDIAKEYFLDLVERNLILVSEHKFNARIIRCKIHDLLRNLCVKEAKNERFFHITSKIFCHFRYGGVDHGDVALHPGGLRVFRCYGCGLDHPTTVNNQANLRYLNYDPDLYRGFIPFDKLVHLHTIHADVFMTDWYFLRFNIWEMPQLRHVNIEFFRPDPPPEIEGGNSLIVLEKLETLVMVQYLIFTEEVIRRIPNIKKLGVRYFKGSEDDWDYRVMEEAIDWRHFGLNNLERINLNHWSVDFRRLRFY